MASVDAKIVIMYTSFSCLQSLMSPWRSHQVPAWHDMTTGLGKLPQIVGDGDVMVSSSCHLTQPGIHGGASVGDCFINWCGKTSLLQEAPFPGLWS